WIVISMVSSRIIKMIPVIPTVFLMTVSGRSMKIPGIIFGLVPWMAALTDSIEINIFFIECSTRKIPVIPIMYVHLQRMRRVASGSEPVMALMCWINKIISPIILLMPDRYRIIISYHWSGIVGG